MRLDTLAAAAACVMAAPASAATIVTVAVDVPSATPPATGSCPLKVDKVSFCGPLVDGAIEGMQFSAIYGDNVPFEQDPVRFTYLDIQGVAGQIITVANNRATLDFTLDGTRQWIDLPEYGFNPVAAVVYSRSGTFRISGFGLAALVPEPTTWALMILGFGAVGASMRRKRPQLQAG